MLPGLILGLLIGALATLIVFPETPMARALHRVLVAPAARRLNRVRLGHLVFALVLTTMGAGLFALFEGEGLRLFGMMAPDVVGWFAMFDVSLFLDVFAMALALAVTTRLRAVRDQIIARATRLLDPVRRAARGGRQRARRTRSTPARPKRSDDPDPFGAGYAFG